MQESADRRNRPMTWWIIVLEALAFAAIFTVSVFLAYRGDKKYSAA